MRRFMFLTAVLASFALVMAPAAAADVRAVQPFEYDPGHTGIVEAAWMTQGGLPDAGKSMHALYLAKMGPTTADAAAGVMMKGVEGLELTELGFDVEDGGWCGAGAPRFNLLASDGFHFLGGCANATKYPDTPVPGWTRVRIDPYDPGQAFPPVSPGATVEMLYILFDEGTDVGPGYVVLDNIDVNGILIGKPGNAS